MLSSLTSLSITRNVFSTTTSPRRRLLSWRTLILISVLIATLAGTKYAYSQAIDWWNNELEIKRQVVEVDTTNPVFTEALVKWVTAKAGNTPNTSPEMLTQIVISAFKESAIRNIDPFLILAVIAVESRFNYMATSTSGAKGLMQIIPYWHKNKISVVEVYDPVANVRAGTKILREYLNLSKGNLNNALLRYNGTLGVPGANYHTKVLSVRNDLSKFVEKQIRKNYETPL